MSWDTETLREALDRLYDLGQELDLVQEREESEHLIEFIRGAVDGLLRCDKAKGND